MSFYVLKKKKKNAGGWLELLASIKQNNALFSLYPCVVTVCFLE